MTSCSSLPLSLMCSSIDFFALILHTWHICHSLYVTFLTAFTMAQMLSLLQKPILGQRPDIQLLLALSGLTTVSMVIKWLMIKRIRSHLVWLPIFGTDAVITQKPIQGQAPCGLRGCKNGPAPFPGRMSYKATKPGLAVCHILACFYCIVVY